MTTAHPQILLHRVAATMPAEVLITLVVASRVELALRRHTLSQLATASGLRLATGDGPVRGQRPGDSLLPRWAVRRIAVVEAVMRRWPFGQPDARCLRRSLVLGHRLRRADPALRLGVRRTVNGLTAHAWLEFGEGWTADPEAADFLPLHLPHSDPRR